MPTQGVHKRAGRGEGPRLAALHQRSPRPASGPEHQESGAGDAINDTRRQRSGFDREVPNGSSQGVVVAVQVEDPTSDHWSGGQRHKHRDDHRQHWPS